jgi:hypothetical protein
MCVFILSISRICAQRMALHSLCSYYLPALSGYPRAASMKINPLRIVYHELTNNDLISSAWAIKVR